MVNPLLDRSAAIIELLTTCSARCPGCYMDGSQSSRFDEGGVFTIDSVKEYLDFLDPNNQGLVETLDILGGEPLLVWELLKKVVLECQRRNIKPWLFTNMAHMTKSRAEWLLKHNVFITGKWNTGFPEEQEDWEFQGLMVGRNSAFARSIWRGIQAARAVGYQEPMFSIENLVRPLNVKQVPAFYEMCFELNIRPDLELPAACDSLVNNYRSFIPSVNELGKMIKGVTIIHKQYGKEMFLPVPPHVTGPCSFYKKSTYARYTGEIQPCSGNRAVVGNFFDPSCSIEQVLEHQVMRARRLIATDNGQQYMSGVCRNCADWDSCRGGCRVGPENSGNPFGSCFSCFKYLKW